MADPDPETPRVIVRDPRLSLIDAKTRELIDLCESMAEPGSLSATIAIISYREAWHYAYRAFSDQAAIRKRDEAL